MTEKLDLIIGMTASISIYKTLEIIRLFKKSGVNVIPVMTQDAKRFISPLLVSSLSESDVYSDMFDESGGKFYHIMLSRGAGAILIAPATANTIAKIANGFADNLLTSIVLASEIPVIIAPAMNVRMFENRITQQNISRLKKLDRFKFVMPESGELACGDIGTGRLADISDIFDYSMCFLHKYRILQGKKIMVSAGPTREFMDTVRFLSNPSSGKMGYELARVAHWLGADVTLVSGPVNIKPPHGVRVINVVSASEMQKAILNENRKYDLLIMNAAISDWRFKKVADKKLKRDGKTIDVELIENNDILKRAVQSRRFRFTLGFAAESENLLRNAKEKVTKKGIDGIIVNNIRRSDVGFASDFNEGKIILKDGSEIDIERCSKREMAYKIFEAIGERL